YKVELLFPSRGGLYWGFFDEIFSVLESHVETSVISTNRIGFVVGYNTYQFCKLEFHLMREDQYKKEYGLADRAWMPRLVVKHIL
ncbi:MAG: hypothetical protein OEQ53_19800, partial [Saprospiraceae bacterium]|nr:hypothetical protein [Saprospiraceae bacterium]